MPLLPPSFSFHLCAIDHGLRSSLSSRQRQPAGRPGRAGEEKNREMRRKKIHTYMLHILYILMMEEGGENDGDDHDYDGGGGGGGDYGYDD